MKKNAELKHRIAEKPKNIVQPTYDSNLVDIALLDLLKPKTTGSWSDILNEYPSTKAEDQVIYEFQTPDGVIRWQVWTPQRVVRLYGKEGHTWSSKQEKFHDRFIEGMIQPLSKESE